MAAPGNTNTTNYWKTCSWTAPITIGRSTRPSQTSATRINGWVPSKGLPSSQTGPIRRVPGRPCPRRAETVEWAPELPKHSRRTGRHADARSSREGLHRVHRKGRPTVELVGASAKPNQGKETSASGLVPVNCPLPGHGSSFSGPPRNPSWRRNPCLGGYPHARRLPVSECVPVTQLCHFKGMTMFLPRAWELGSIWARRGSRPTDLCPDALVTAPGASDGVHRSQDPRIQEFAPSKTKTGAENLPGRSTRGRGARNTTLLADQKGRLDDFSLPIGTSLPRATPDG